MDGYASPYSSLGLAGILYAEDFGDPPGSPPPASAPPDGPLPAPEAERALTPGDLDAARVQAVQAASEAWEQGATERRTLALEAMAGELRAARAEAEARQHAMAEELARTVLGVLSAMLPELCEAHGDAEVRGLLRRLLPLVGRPGPAVVRVHAGLLPILAEDLARLDEDLPRAIELCAANLPPGDVRVGWEDGGLTRDGAAIRAAVAECLAQLGLLPPNLPAPERSSPHVATLAHQH